MHQCLCVQFSKVTLREGERQKAAVQVVKQMTEIELAKEMTIRVRAGQEECELNL